MQLVERHVINKGHKSWGEIDHLSFLSKNLWNFSNYHCRQHFFQTNQYLNFKQLYHLVSQTPDYLALPTKISKQIIRRLDQAWTSFRRAIQVYRASPEKFKARPRLPGYKDTAIGRNILIYPGKESVSRPALRRGICKLSMSNLEFPTKVTEDNIVEVRIVPQACCYVIEVVYESEQTPLVTGQGIAGIDLGLSNLMAVTSNQSGVRPLLINGRPLKAINQLYNKRKAELQSFQAHSQLRVLTHKRNCRVENYIHTASRRVIDWCKQVGVGLLIIGKNDGWKDSINIGRRNNQHFTCIPHARLIEMLQYKGELAGIHVVLTQEAYTSRASAIDGDPLPKYGETSPKFSGRRVHRGLYKTLHGSLLNADTNGAMNIARKVISDAFRGQDIGGLPYSPVMVNPLRTKGLDSLGRFVQV